MNFLKSKIANLKSKILQWRVNRARSKNSSIRQQHAFEVSRAIQPTPFSNKSVTQLKKLARRGHRRGYESVSKIAEAELRRRLLIGRLAQP